MSSIRRPIMRRTNVFAIFSVLTLTGLSLTALTLTSPANAESARPALRPVAQQQHAVLQLTGQVRNGEPLDIRANDSKIVVPQGLPAVAHAKVSIPQLSLSTTTNAQGDFAFSVPAASARKALSVHVTAAGFGAWRETGIKLT